MRGALEITFERREGKTLAREVRQRAPLRIVRPFYPEGESPAHLYILNATGGILEGDRMEMTIRLENGAGVFITTPAATRVSPTPSGEARQKTTFVLDPGATLEYLPEPLLPYAGSAFYQETDIFLGEGATLFFLDLLAPGRLGGGEAFAYRVYENHFKVSDAEGVLAQESFRLAPSDRPVDLLGAMEEYSHLGSLYLFCSEEDREALLEVFRSIDAPGLFWGGSLLARRGLVVRALAHDTPSLQGFFFELWAHFRERVIGRPLPAVRRY